MNILGMHIGPIGEEDLCCGLVAHPCCTVEWSHTTIILGIYMGAIGEEDLCCLWVAPQRCHVEWSITILPLGMHIGPLLDEVLHLVGVALPCRLVEWSVAHRLRDYYRVGLLPRRYILLRLRGRWDCRCGGHRVPWGDLYHSWGLHHHHLGLLRGGERCSGLLLPSGSALCGLGRGDLLLKAEQIAWVKGRGLE